MMPGNAGEVRNLWACLLWLNRPGHVIYSSVDEIADIV
jgi:hypothetical protein